MLQIKKGDIVVSTKGRDVGKVYVVKHIENEYVYLVDGRGRTISNPKKKKFKHIRPANICIEALNKKFENNEKVQDLEIRKTIDNLNII